MLEQLFLGLILNICNEIQFNFFFEEKELHLFKLVIYRRNIKSKLLKIIKDEIIFILII